jgi:hypothetical protein
MLARHPGGITDNLSESHFRMDCRVKPGNDDEKFVGFQNARMMYYMSRLPG